MEDSNSTTYYIREARDFDLLDLDPEVKAELLREFKAALGPVSRCSICLQPGPLHHAQSECITAFQSKCAALEDDPGYIPARAQPPLPFDQMKQRAYDHYRQNIEKFQRRGLLWHEPTAEEIFRVTGMRR